jgi:hypothetical protein
VPTCSTNAGPAIFGLRRMGLPVTGCFVANLSINSAGTFAPLRRIPIALLLPPHPKIQDYRCLVGDDYALPYSQALFLWFCFVVFRFCPVAVNLYGPRPRG